MKMSAKNKKAFNQGKQDRLNNVPFERNYYLHLRSLISSSWWDKGWLEQDKDLRGWKENKIK